MKLFRSRKKKPHWYYTTPELLIERRKAREAELCANGNSHDDYDDEPLYIDEIFDTPGLQKLANEPRMRNILERMDFIYPPKPSSIKKVFFYL